MRLADFILANLKPILADWEVFARSIWPGPATDRLTLRDHAEDILRATARDMRSAQTPTEQSDKSKGEGGDARHSGGVNSASDIHAIGRVRSGFDLLAVIAEYRALRASVIRLWREGAPQAEAGEVEDLTRFNESIDQSLTEAARSYSRLVDRSRHLFLAILGHDLRGPLNAITLSAELLTRTDSLDAESSEVAARISSSAKAMNGMIGDLLDFSGTVLGGAMPITRAPLDLKKLAEQVAAEAQCVHPQGLLQFEARGDLTGEWDRDRLRQVISNLLANAIHHGGRSGPVGLSITGDDDAVSIAVQNGGTPIPPDSLPTLFDPLVRGTWNDASIQRAPGSMGLGLYIVNAIVIAHGGAIKATSSAELGTLFSVRLPRHAADGAPKAGSHAAR